jgi:adenosylmethionine-8-amino-7-oxononanoate aminotransferase
VLTGFGRTGKFFAGEYLRHTADIICLSKGLTGGAMALGVTATTEKIFRAFLSDDRLKTLFHGHSFTANPIACSAALASLDLLQREDCLPRIRNISRRHTAFGATLEGHPAVRNLRILGTILAFEINTGRDGYINSIGTSLTKAALQNGIYLRPLGNTVYLMPPYCITEKEMDQVYTFLVHFLATLDPVAGESDRSEAVKS